MSRPTLFHSLTFRDVAQGIEFLEAVGFTRRAVYEDDSGTVAHAQYNWREVGGVMFGASGRRSADDQHQDAPGQAMCYCVVECDDDVDAVYRRALDAGGTSVQAPTDPDYGGRSCTVADPEGNQFSFGSYAGE